ncbi:hypothetical protein [Fusobacterium varium]|uniref:hypothetical protein n=1 Tax=Fusobacterium varium TaxID=856 RepID=UPI002FE44BFD
MNETKLITLKKWTLFLSYDKIEVQCQGKGVVEMKVNKEYVENLFSDIIDKNIFIK